MCLKCKKRKEKIRKKISKGVNLGLGLFSGAMAGLMLAPKKGKELRAYFKSAEFKKRKHKAKEKVETAKGVLKDKAEMAQGRFHRFFHAVRKRFGM